MAQSKKDAADISCPSSEHRKMDKWLCKIRDVLDGEECIRAAKTRYLPKWIGEEDADYERRLAQSPFWPGFADALEGIVGKPFSSPLTVAGDTGQANQIDQKITDVIEDIDGRGNSLHVFARGTFWDGVSDGLAGILVDYPKADGEAKTLADEKKLNARPYWCAVKAENILSCFYESIGGRQYVRQMVIRECETEQDGYGEKEVERYRVMWPGKYQVWERQLDKVLTMVDSGTTSMPIVPFIPFYTGQRFGNYGAKPPLLELANQNISIYQRESRHEIAMTLAGYPMLKIIGVNTDSLPTEENWRTGKKEPAVAVGAGKVIVIPQQPSGQQGDADFIQPESTTLTESRNGVEAAKAEFLRLAKQPMQPGSGNITATANALSASKSNSAISTWALSLKDCLDQALVITCAWMSLEPNVSVNVPTDFTSDMRPDSEVQTLLAARTTGEISRETFQTEWKRRGMLSADFDPAVEQLRLESEGDLSGVTA